MNELARTLIVVCILASFVVAPIASAQYDSKTDIISMYKSLCSAHPNEACYEIIGKSYLGKDIYLFKFGNISGGRVLWDAQLHGAEDAGSEIAYWFAQWLMTNTTPQAKNIRRHNCFMVIPVANPDTYTRTNANRYSGTVKYGVNLNRNFVYGWGESSWTSDKSSMEYRGPFPASEKETQALRSVFKRYRPSFYVNSHMHGGPTLFYWKFDNPTTVKAVITAMSTLKALYGGTPYRVTSLSGAGFAIGDAWSFGIQSWLLEIDGSTIPSLDTLRNYYYPNCRLILLAMLQLCG